MVGTKDKVIWVLQGQKLGDNRQMVCLANATGLTTVVKPLRFNILNAVPNWLLGKSLISLTLPSRRLLAPPWPDVIVSAGRRSVPAAMWICRQAKKPVRLVHIGRPWAPLNRFDLVITTPQYALPAADNVLHNLMVLDEPGTMDADPGWKTSAGLADLPKPWIGVSIGGPSRPLVFDTRMGKRLAQVANDAARKCGGSLILMAGPRSPQKVLDAICRDISVPFRFIPWMKDGLRFSQLAPLCDRLLVTGDSASVLACAAAVGRPLEVFPLRTGCDPRFLLLQGVRHLLSEKNFVKLVAAGLFTSVRNVAAYAEALRAAGLLDGGPAAKARRRAELQTAVARVLALL